MVVVAGRYYTTKEKDLDSRGVWCVVYGVAKPVKTLRFPPSQGETRYAQIFPWNLAPPFMGLITNLHHLSLKHTEGAVKNYLLFTKVLSKCECFIKMRAAFLAPILARIMNQGESKKVALILMKHSQFDRTLRYI